ncbi:MAG: N-acetyltransferase DgcN [Rubrimonas sp.]|uniref:N-acetyltransferase DgcN n=1 Tax=Rubrimonas sp. TaxID=2036015 RepID=UPI002FDE75F7
MSLRQPYLLFLGDAPDMLAAKVALGVKQWRPEACLGQLSMPGCKADLGLAEMSVGYAVSAGARTLLVGVANRGGVVAPSWVAVLKAALEAGLDLAAGLHQRLSDIPELAETARARGRAIHDVRSPERPYPVGDGRKRSGKRLLPVGTDCSCGKMYTALALEAALRARGRPATFRATGQTGILITGEGVPLDAVVADFISGAVETVSPDAPEDHWDLIEGQGSLLHPSFAGVTLGLIHGAQPDALVICHEPTRTHLRGLPHYPIPSLETVMEQCLTAARLTNPKARFAGASINTHALDDAAAAACLAEIEARLGLPAVDPVRTGVERIAEALE